MPAILEGDDFHNPKLTGPRKSKEIPGGGVYSAYASTKIHAPPKDVYDAVLNVGDWKLWNRSVYNVTITKTLDPHARGSGSHKRIQGGSCMMFHVRLSPDRETRLREVVTLVEKLKTSANGHSTPCITRIRWRLDNAALTTPAFLLKSERVNEIEEQKDGTTIYRTWQVFSGPVARYMRKRLEIPMRDRMQEWAEDIKAWVEKTPEQKAAAGAQRVDSAESDPIDQTSTEPPK